MTAERLAPALLVLSLLLIPVAMRGERLSAAAWRERLVQPDFIAEPNRHTPRHSQGTYLPARITHDTHLTPADNPILVAGTTHIPAGITVTVDPGTTLFAHEFSRLTVAGTLVLRGTAAAPIVLQSNEAHPDNQIWYGLTFQPGSRADIRHTRIVQASPAVTCLAGSRLTAHTLTADSGSLAIFSTTPQCRLTDSTIRGAYDGVIAAEPDSLLFNTTVSARRSATRRLNPDNP